MPVTITDVKTILTQPAGSRLVVVKLLTSEPGLYGLGCATFTQRFRAVHTAIEHHLKPFLVGKDADDIEDLWQTAMVNGYWRNGPVLNNAISGMDMALWDIKGKRAGMPVYQLLGGKCREAADTYVHADGASPEEVAENVLRYMAQDFRHVRCQIGGYGGRKPRVTPPEGAKPGDYFDPRSYMRRTVGMFEHLRASVGGEVELTPRHPRAAHARRRRRLRQAARTLQPVLPRRRPGARRQRSGSAACARPPPRPSPWGSSSTTPRNGCP